MKFSLSSLFLYKRLILLAELFQFIYKLIQYFRQHNCNDTFVIYTGYYPNEIKKYLEALSKFDNIIIKFGRYKQNSNSIFDEVLGVELASDNQYALNLKDVLKQILDKHV